MKNRPYIYGSFNRKCDDGICDTHRFDVGDGSAVTKKEVYCRGGSRKNHQPEKIISPQTCFTFLETVLVILLCFASITMIGVLIIGLSYND